MIHDHLSQKGFEVENGLIRSCNGYGLKNLLNSGLKWLEVHKDTVNKLNVFPVPDSDTGTNMVLTMRAAVAAANDVDDTQAGAIAAAAAYGALMGARGNSGVILSQFWDGVAYGLSGKKSFNVAELTTAIELGALHAYNSVVEPVEGTLLTVARAAAEVAKRSAQEPEKDIVGLWADLVEGIKVAQSHTTEQLSVLKEAGVPDSGGLGLLCLFEGGLRFLYNQSFAPELSEVAVQPSFKVAERDYGFDVQFLVKGNNLDVKAIRSHIDSLGWSTVVVGNAEMVKIHLHADTPQPALDYGAQLGTVSDIIVEDLTEQVRAFAATQGAVRFTPSKESDADMALVSIVSGTGFTEIFQSLGVNSVVAENGATSEQLLTTIEQFKANNILILPNNRHIMLTAQIVQERSKKNVEVVPTTTVAQGISAAVVYNNQSSLEENRQRMFDAAQQVHTIEITHAPEDAETDHRTINREARQSRLGRQRGMKNYSFSLLDDSIDSIFSGDAVGYLNGEFVNAGQNELDVVLAGLAQINLDDLEIITIYFGQDRSSTQAKYLADEIEKNYPNLDLEIYSGGHPNYCYIISVE